MLMLLAVMPGQPELVRQILAAAPDPAAFVAAADLDGLNAVHWAASVPHRVNVLRVLLEANPAAAAATTSIGTTPLHLAAGHGDPEAVRLLLEAAPAAASKQNSDGRMPFEVVRWARDGDRWTADGYHTPFGC